VQTPIHEYFPRLYRKKGQVKTFAMDCQFKKYEPNFIGSLTKSMSWAAFQLHFKIYYFTSNKMLNVWATT